MKPTYREPHLPSFPRKRESRASSRHDSEVSGSPLSRGWRRGSGAV